MTTGTSVLRKEHEAIVRMLEVTEEVSSRFERGDSVAPETLSDLLEFFRLFADQCHHGKEEDCLFPLLESKGMPRGGGPVGVMLHEHEQGRSLIREMGEAADSYHRREKGSGSRWARAARGYTALLRDHIAKENNILFVMAENALSDSEQSDLAAAFENVEREKMGPGTHERLHAIMEKLASEFLTQG